MHLNVGKQFRGGTYNGVELIAAGERVRMDWSELPVGYILLLAGPWLRS